MSDPVRTDTSRALEPMSEADRDAKIEQLLLAGLDHYFAARYEQAINVWTRVLFVDRSHARAHAYIERARSALAERQRESEELLQTGLAAFNRGDAEAARQLLQLAIDRGAPADEALAVLGRLDRLEPGRVEPGRVEAGGLERGGLDSGRLQQGPLVPDLPTPGDFESRIRESRDPESRASESRFPEPRSLRPGRLELGPSEFARYESRTAASHRRTSVRPSADAQPSSDDRGHQARRGWLAASAVALLVSGSLIVAIGRFGWPDVAGLQPGAPAQAAPPFSESAPELPRRGEMALDRARALAASGRLRDALDLLDGVRPTDPERSDADRLRADVQKRLLAVAGAPTAGSNGSTEYLGQP